MTVIHEGEVGIWGLGVFQVFPQYAAPEVVSLDDKGRCLVHVGYSGKWTANATLEDREWLGAVAHVDLDPVRPGAELYVGGKRGNLYQVIPHAGGGADTRLIAKFPAKELHTLVGAEINPARPGSELLAFLHTGEVFEIRPDPNAETGFAAHLLTTLAGRVREALVLSPNAGDAPRVITVSRSGELGELQWGETGLHNRSLGQENSGLGRLAQKPRRKAEPRVLYVTRDDGLILRLEETSDGFQRTPIYAGPEGPRGIAAGYFGANQDEETVAVFGYSKRVQLLTRQRDGSFLASDLFLDLDQGHWLMSAELDGRNGTHELLGSGYGGRVFLLARRPGFGLPGVATAPDGERESSAQSKTPGPRPLRIATSASKNVQALSTLSYGGGFETKTLLYDTLVRRDSSGNLAPGLAESWKFDAQSSAWEFQLRPGATFHDGTRISAAAVAEHFRRFIGLPEHAWLPAGRHVTNALAVGEHTLRLVVDRPVFLPGDLCAINPGGVRAPSTLDRQGEFVHPIGSGTHRFLGLREGDAVLRYARRDAPNEVIDLVRTRGSSAEVAAALRDGRLDIVTNGWIEFLNPSDLDALEKDPAFELSSSPGSSVLHLVFQSQRGPTRHLALRRHMVSQLSREALIAESEHGRATAATSFFGPAVTAWPTRPPPEILEGTRSVEAEAPVVILANAGRRREVQVAQSIHARMTKAGIPTELVLARSDQLERRRKAGDFGVTLDATWGIPYDPDLSLAALFLPSSKGTAATAGVTGIDPDLVELVAELQRTLEAAQRAQIYLQIEELMNERVLIWPLFAPHHTAVLRKGSGQIGLSPDLYRFDPARLMHRPE